MWLTPGKASGLKKRCSKTLHDGTTRTWALYKSGEGSQTAVRLDPINEGVQPDVLQRGRAGMACQRNKSQDVRTVTWNVSSMVSRSGEVVNALHRRKIDLCCAQEMRWRMLGDNGRRYKFFWQGSNKGTAGVLVYLLLRDELTVLSMWSESISGSCM